MNEIARPMIDPSADDPSEHARNPERPVKAEEPKPEPSKPARTDGDGERPPAPHPPADRHWRQLAVACLALLALINGALAFYAFYSLGNLRKSIDFSLWRSEHRYQALDAQIAFDSRRRHLLLGLRDEILATNPSLDWADAYRYAALAIAASEKYVAVDPILLVSIGIVESGYDERAESEAGARGIYQLFPSTGRLLSRSLGWEYNEELLFDPVKNTELAGLYLEILFAVHDDPTYVLAEYKEGALSAGYLRTSARELDPNSGRFLGEVMENYERLVAKYGTLHGLADDAVLPTEGTASPATD